MEREQPVSLNFEIPHLRCTFCWFISLFRVGAQDSDSPETQQKMSRITEHLENFRSGPHPSTKAMFVQNFPNLSRMHRGGHGSGRHSSKHSKRSFVNTFCHTFCIPTSFIIICYWIAIGLLGLLIAYWTYCPSTYCGQRACASDKVAGPV